MDEERLLILKMIAEGKITAEEGAALLDALKDESHSASTNEPGGEQQKASGTEQGPGGGRFEKFSDSDLARRLEEEAGKFAENVQKAAEKFSRLLEERIEKEIKPALSNVPSFLSNLPFVGNLFGPVVTVEEEHSGDLPGDEVDVYYSGRNGHLEVVVWDEPGYRLESQKIIKGAVSEVTRRQDALVVNVEPGRLEVHVRAGVLNGVNSKLYLPRDKRYRLHLRTSNGWMRIQEVSGDLLEALTSNGRLEIKRAACERIVARTSNGAIECTQVSGLQFEAETSNGRIAAKTTAAEVKCRTSNGSIQVYPGEGQGVCLEGEGRYELSTSNGSITVGIPKDLVPVTSIDARTSFGTIRIEPAGLAVKVQEERVNDRYVVAEGSEYEVASRRLRILAQTSNSGVTVTEV